MRMASARELLVEEMVEADLSPLVDDDERVGQFGRAEETIDQRRLARPEKTGDDMESDPFTGRHDRTPG